MHTRIGIERRRGESTFRSPKIRPAPSPTNPIGKPILQACTALDLAQPRFSLVTAIRDFQRLPYGPPQPSKLLHLPGKKDKSPDVPLDRAAIAALFTQEFFLELILDDWSRNLCRS